MAFGTVLAGMNIAFYLALERLALGTAVAIEFIGPVAVGALTGRGWRERAAIALAAIGVVMIVGVTLDIGGADAAVGLAWILLAAAGWAGYIMLGRKVATPRPGEPSGLESLSVSMAAGAVVFAPFGLPGMVGGDAAPIADAHLLALLLVVALFSSVLPYGIDQLVLRHAPTARFSVLLSVFPATALLVGAVMLAEVPTVDRGHRAGRGLRGDRADVAARAARPWRPWFRPNRCRFHSSRAFLRDVLSMSCLSGTMLVRARDGRRCGVRGEATVLHADLDAFYASVEQRDSPSLRGRPLIVGGGVVAAASYEAKARGVRTAMATSRARALCPEAVVVPPRMEAYSEASRAVFAIFHDTTPHVEGLSIDEAFLEVGGLRRIAGHSRTDRRAAAGARPDRGGARDLGGRRAHQVPRQGRECRQQARRAARRGTRP